jgi:hypothetical protein
MVVKSSTPIIKFLIRSNLHMQHFPSLPWRLVFLAALLLVILGCNGDGTRKANIRGKVTLDGEAVPSGAVNFEPTDGKTPTAGAVIKDGEYRAEVPLGSMRVRILSPKVVGQRSAFNAPNSPKQDIVKERIPPQYNTETTLTVEIKSDSRDIDFALKSKK